MAAADFRHLAVGADVDHVIVAVEPEVLHQANLGRQLIVVGGNGAAFEGVEELGGVEAEHFGFAEIAHHSAPERAAERVRGIKEQFQLVRAAPVPDSASTSHGRPQIWTPMIPVVRGVIICSTRAGSRL